MADTAENRDDTSTIDVVPAKPLSVVVKRWAAWTPGVQTREEWNQWVIHQQAVKEGEAGTESGQDVETAKPDVKAIPAMIRRRLSPLGKMALSVAWPLVDAGQQIPSVFCSRHGELERSVTMLKALADEEPLSPTQFSLSVHNAIGGVFSIARKDPSAITALALGDGDFSQALVEAEMILEEGNHDEILCVIYDEPIPDIYRDSSSTQVAPSAPYAAAFVLGSSQSSIIEHEDDQPHLAFSVALAEKTEQQEKSIENCVESNIGASVAQMPDALRFIEFMLNDSKQNLSLHSKRHQWKWQKNG